MLHSLAIRNLVGGRQALALEDLNRALPLARGGAGPMSRPASTTCWAWCSTTWAATTRPRACSARRSSTPAPSVSSPLRLRLRSNVALALARGAQRAKSRREDDWRARSDEAVAEARQVWRHGEELLPGDRAAFLDTLATALVAQGALDDAHRALDEAEASFTAHGNDLGLLYASLTRARAWLEAGEPAKALDALARGKEAATRSGATVLLDELEVPDVAGARTAGGLPQRARGAPGVLSLARDAGAGAGGGAGPFARGHAGLRPRPPGVAA